MTTKSNVVLDGILAWEKALDKHYGNMNKILDIS